MARDGRRQRIAKNETRFRDVNERLERGLAQAGHAPSELEVFVCECGDSGCEALLRLSLEEYEAVRRDSRWFAIAPGHSYPQVEQIIDRHARYEVVEKVGADTVAIVDATDARGDHGGLRSADPPPVPASARADYGVPGDVAAEVATVQAIYDAFARRDLEGAMPHFSDDVELSLPQTAGRAGRDGPYRGHAGVRAYFGDLNRIWSELTLHADDIRAITGGVVVFGSIRGRVGDEEVRRQAVWSWKLRDGLAVSVRVNDLGDG